LLGVVVALLFFVLKKPALTQDRLNELGVDGGAVEMEEDRPSELTPFFAGAQESRGFRVCLTSLGVPQTWRW
jgi:hypothetical protein